jgi:hypothetical protein
MKTKLYSVASWFTFDSRRLWVALMILILLIAIAAAFLPATVAIAGGAPGNS